MVCYDIHTRGITIVVVVVVVILLLQLLLLLLLLLIIIIIITIMIIIGVGYVEIVIGIREASRKGAAILPRVPMTTPNVALTPRIESFRSFFRWLFPLGIVVSAQAVFAEHIILRPCGQQLLKCLGSEPN